MSIHFLNNVRFYSLLGLLLIVMVIIAACSPEEVIEVTREVEFEVTRMVEVTTEVTVEKIITATSIHSTPTSEPPTSTPTVISPTATPTKIPPTLTPQAIGAGRANPFPNSEVIIDGGWEVEVMEYIRGESARQNLELSSSNVSDDGEYILVKLRIKSNHTDNNTNTFYRDRFKATGDMGLLYSLTSNITFSGPSLEYATALTNGQQAEGWIAFFVSPNEGNLMLIIGTTQFVALDDGASIEIPIEFIQTPPDDLGTDRGHPVPFGASTTTEDWNVTILEVLRGNDAWLELQLASQSNDPPHAGMEFVLMKVSVRNFSTMDTVVTIDQGKFHLTGNASKLYGYKVSWSWSGDRLSASLFPGGQAEGWILFEIGQGETNLISIFGNNTPNQRFIAVEEGANLSVPEELAEIQPNDLGSRVSQPANPDEIIITDDWQLSVTEVLRGDDAWLELQLASQNNKPPEEGMVYVLVQIHIRSIGTLDALAYVDTSSFKLVTSDATVFNSLSLYSITWPFPPVNAQLFPGGEAIGWVAYQVPQEEKDLILLFDRPESERRYIYIFEESEN